METIVTDKQDIQHFVDSQEVAVVAVANFPGSSETFGIYRDRIMQGLAEIPVRQAGQYETANTTVYDIEPSPDFSDSDIVEIARSNYASERARQLADSSWWCAIDDTAMGFLGRTPELAETTIYARHTFTPMVDGKPSGKGYSVYEMGGLAAASDIDTIANVLNIIDQYSGGALASGEGSNIILSNDAQWHHNRRGGVNTEHGTYINMLGIKEMAEAGGVDKAHILSNVIVHEVLGHELERSHEGTIGTYFTRHFDYSEGFTPGVLFNSIHQAIIPKNGVTSKPVREYGAVNSAEDYATSTDAMVAEAEGWDASLRKLARAKSTPDEVRSDLVLQMMQEVALAAKVRTGDRGMPGVVGGDLRYEKDEHGTVIRSYPARTLQHSVVGGQETVQQELETTVNGRLPGEITYCVMSLKEVL